MNEETRNAVPGGDSNHIYKLEKLSGEVKVLKWGAGISVTMLFAYLTLLSYQITDVRTSQERQIGAVREEVSALRTSQERQLGELREGQTFIRERLGVIEQRLTGMDQRITTNGQRIGALPHL